MNMDQVIPPGSTIGILGGGQLGRMLAMAAARLGYRCHVYTPEADSPAAQVCAAATVAGWYDRDALIAFAKAIDLVTYEFENVPVRAGHLVTRQGVPVRPGLKALDVSQNRMAEKYFLRDMKVPMVRWIGVPRATDLAEAVARLGTPAILKAAQFGYDGKGQVRIEAGTDLAAAWAEMGGANGVLEEVAEFATEISVIVARGLDGHTLCFDIGENRHAGGVLATTTVPAAVSPAVADEAVRLATAIAVELEVVGLLAVEMFVMSDGRLLVNELAPRPHNSGHWTIDGCVTSQFEQHVRAICGLPLGAVDRFGDAVMENLLGDAAGRWAELLADPHAKLHLYGKDAPRPGRKMGHVTRVTR